MTLLRISVLLLLVDCAALDPCPTSAPNGLVSGTGSLSEAGTVLQATDFQWVDGYPDRAPAQFLFAFGDATMECSTQSVLSKLTEPTPLSELAGDGCRITTGQQETLDWTGGTITVTSVGSDTYYIRLDAKPTVLGDVTVQLDGLTGATTVLPVSCGPGNSSNGFW